MMKKNIDLRPPEFIRRREFYLPRLLIALGAIFFILAVASASFFYYLQYTNYRLTRQALQEELRYLEREVQELQELEAEISVLRKQMNLAKDLKERAIPWSEYLDHLWYTQPWGIWLQTIRADEPPHVCLQGEGRSLERVFSYAQVVEEFPFFEEVTLRSVRRESEKYLFLIEATLKGVEVHSEPENTRKPEPSGEFEAAVENEASLRAEAEAVE